MWASMALRVPQIFVRRFTQRRCRNGATGTWWVLLDLGSRERGCEADLALENPCLSLLVSLWKKSSCARGAGARHGSPLGWSAVPLCPGRARGEQGLHLGGTHLQDHRDERHRGARQLSAPGARHREGSLTPIACRAALAPGSAVSASGLLLTLICWMGNPGRSSLGWHRLLPVRCVYSPTAASRLDQPRAHSLLLSFRKQFFPFARLP